MNKEEFAKLSDKATNDAQFRERLLKDPKSAGAEIGVVLSDAEHAEIRANAADIRKRGENLGAKVTQGGPSVPTIFYPIFAILK